MAFRPKCTTVDMYTEHTFGTPVFSEDSAISSPYSLFNSSAQGRKMLVAEIREKVRPVLGKLLDCCVIVCQMHDSHNYIVEMPTIACSGKSKCTNMYCNRFHPTKDCWTIKYAQQMYIDNLHIIEELLADGIGGMYFHVMYRDTIPPLEESLFTRANSD